MTYALEKHVFFDMGLSALFSNDVPETSQKGSSKHPPQDQDQGKRQRISKRIEGYEVYYHDGLSRFSLFPPQEKTQEHAVQVGQSKYIVSLLEAPSRRRVKGSEMVQGKIRH